MSTVVSRPEIPLQVITPADVRASIGRARRSLEKAAEEIVWQIEMEAWRTLGYSSWTAMREAEYGGAAFMVPSKSRPEIVARIRAAGLTQKEIAETAGVSRPTVASDLASMPNPDIEAAGVITNSRGQSRPATYTRSEPESEPDTSDDEVIDAEIVDNPQDIQDATDTTTDPATAEPVINRTCPTCHGTGKVTQ
ncbi:winged helix-turn-helix domain-containing protein [Gordonia sp. UCD-TK1]|uniref:winged helix-turn-helix domain-containing protein n=1 Tax=Gordonia sp. UCD-TK1 TaxID=1857893 RepID=UPI00080E4255|nr:winged helix-turn-helix domain-containing protein [Gordonia sp. UCD-TK1]OCH81770.1 hypothetical protein A9310_04055 [Gordonia sp. UCD-TK1]